MIVDVYVKEKLIWLGQLQVPDNIDALLAANDYFGCETEIEPVTPESLDVGRFFGVIIPTYQIAEKKG